jgi:ATP-dependent RNA helicase DeaD
MTLVERTSVESPQPAGGFAALRLGEHVQRALDEIGYSEPTPVQAATYPLAVAGRDIIVQARTGTGKTAAFGIPLVDKLVTREPHVQALVLAPTRELALQSQREIARLGQHKRVHVVAIYGGAPMGRQIDELQTGAQIVSGTPGRVLDHLRRGTFDPSHLRVLILDEMDEMLSMGFAKELSAILELIPDRSKRQTMCFSATVDGEVRRHAERHMNEPEMVSLSSDAIGVEQITHHAYMVPGSDRPSDLVRILEVEDPESAIIFCNMRVETERVAGALKAAGFNADWLNGDLPQKDRERIMAQTREGKLRYLVATDVAARGIDISHLTHVINYTFPESAAVYVHRTGRTGRAGRTGAAVSLVSPDELGRLYYLRLEYKISLIERSLPTRGELNTRAEADRILLLEQAFSAPPATNDLAIARRLLTHPDVERILGGLLHTFLGTHDEVDEEAAAVRRTRKPAEVESPEADRADAARGRDESRNAGRGRRRRTGGRDDFGESDASPRDLGASAEGGDAVRSGADERARPPRPGDRPRGARGERRGGAEGFPSREGAGREGPARDASARERAPREDFPPRDREGREPGGPGREGPGRERNRLPRVGTAREGSARSSEGSLREGSPREGFVRDGALRESSRDRDAEFSSDESGSGFSGSEREGEIIPRDVEGGSAREREGVASRREGFSRERGGRPSARAEVSGQRSRGGEPARRDRGPAYGPRDRDRPAVRAGGPGERDSSRGEGARAADERDGVLLDAFAPSVSSELGASSRDDAAFPEPDTSRDLVAPDASSEFAADGWGEPWSQETHEHLSGLLYLNLGRRDGVRIHDVARLLRDTCGLARAEVGRIRVRDRYTYVDVPPERLDAIIESLTGQTFHDKTLLPERARVIKA